MYDYLESLIINKDKILLCDIEEDKASFARALMNLVGYTVETDQDFALDILKLTLHNAISKFQRYKGLPETGDIDSETYFEILSSIKVTKIDNDKSKFGKSGTIYGIPSTNNYYDFLIYIDDKYIEFDEANFESEFYFERYSDYKCEAISYNLLSNIITLSYEINSNSKFSLYIHISKLDKFSKHINSVFITRSEYDLLSDEKKMDGTMYFLQDDDIIATDGDCTGSISNNIVDSIKDYFDEKFEKMINSKRPLFCYQCVAPAKDRICKYCDSVLWQE